MYAACLFARTHETSGSQKIGSLRELNLQNLCKLKMQSEILWVLIKVLVMLWSPFAVHCLNTKGVYFEVVLTYFVLCTFDI